MRTCMCPRSFAWRPLRRGRLLGPCALALCCRVEPSAAQAPAAPAAAASAESSAPQSAELAEGADGTRAVARFLLERAKERFNRGVLERDASELERAFDALLLGRALSRDPALSFNAARVARELGQCREAQLLYQSFLASEPSAERRARAERQLTELGECDAAELTLDSSVLPGVALGVAAVPPWRLGAAPFGWDELQPGEVAPEARPAWLWALAGGAGASALLTGIFLLQAGSKDAELERFRPDPAAPEQAGAQIRRLQSGGRAAQTRARVFGVLTAGLGIGTLAGFWFTAPAEEAPASDWRVQAAPTELSASWRARF
jgi:hypothetical protein